jgi:ABC-type antimicrobial peptide transport system permease subunit
VEQTLAVKLRPGASESGVENDLARRGFFASSSGGVSGEAVSGWASRNSGFVSILVALLRTVAALDGLVCLYALAQMLALTAQERRRALSIVRACGASVRQLAAVFTGSALPVAALAAPLGIVLERNVVAPTVSRLAASYISLPLSAGMGAIAIVLGGLLVAALAAAAWAARAVVREPVVSGLRQE